MYSYNNQQIPQYQGQGGYGRNQFRQPESQPQMPQYQMYPGFMKGRPVVSIEEARAAQIDLDGSLHVFTDIGNKKIYTKQICPDGTAMLNVYTLSEEPIQPIPANYVTKEEFNSALAEIRLALSNQQQPIVTQKPQKKSNYHGGGIE